MKNHSFVSCVRDAACWVAVLSLLLAVGCDSRKETGSPNANWREPAEDVASEVDPSGEGVQPGTAGSPERPKDDSADDLSNTRMLAIEKSQELVNTGDFAGATGILNEVLLQDPTDVEVLFHLANVTATAGDLPKAVEILSEIPADHPQAGLAALGQSAGWCVRLERYDDAETRYRAVLSQVPAAAPALRQLAHLLNRQGRRHEAAALIRELCKLGNVRQDELHALMALSNAMYDEPPQIQGVVSSGYWPIGDSGMARKRFEEEQYEEVVRLLQPSVSEGTARPAIVALFGRAAAEAQDDESFRWWLAHAGPETRQFSEYWAALGAHLLSQGRFAEAVRALSEAVDRDPTDLRTISRLRQALLVLEKDELAKQFADRWTDVRDSLRDNNRVAGKNPPDPEAISQLVRRLQGLKRPLEALLWQAVEQHYRQSPQSEKEQLNQQRQQLVVQGVPFPGPVDKLCGLDLKNYPLPEIKLEKGSPLRKVQPETPRVASAAAFTNVADRIGLDHTFSVASAPLSFGYAIHQMLGGGVAVLDFDIDGKPDLYLAQGSSDPPGFTSNRSNQLMQHADSAFVETTGNAGATDFGYTLGVASGDWNQDGFPDLVLRNVLYDQMLINQGDGTFRRVQIADQSDSNRVPASAAMADLTGDGLPDIYQANYVDDPRRFVTPPTDDSGRPLQPILPSKFRPGKNELVENDGTGNFTMRELTPDENQAATSLGLVITDFDGLVGNEIFVGNDMKPNQLWRHDPADGWLDIAALRGCAFSFTGASTASMGIAAADLQNNDTIDLHITNYQSESSSLFLSESGIFKDRNLKFRIAGDSHGVLGFGTQAIDYDNDGLRDLVVTNGHIDDAVENEGTFRQPAQLFANLRNRFELVDVDDPSGYWGNQHLGRALASLDFDGNGEMDFVVTHLDAPSALLLNQTNAGNHWLQLQLVGTITERDGIGARVRVRVGDQTFTEWVTAGDGYLCSNENIECFGLGASRQVDSIEIHWPTGEPQVFHDLPVDRRWLIVEGEAEAFPLPSGP